MLQQELINVFSPSTHATQAVILTTWKTFQHVGKWLSGKKWKTFWKDLTGKTVSCSQIQTTNATSSSNAPHSINKLISLEQLTMTFLNIALFPALMCIFNFKVTYELLIYNVMVIFSSVLFTLGNCYAR